MDAFEKILSDQVKWNKTPSIQYILFNQNSILKKYQAGYADIKNQLEANQKTTYNAFSVTKTFTALAVLQLAEQKKISLDHSLKSYLSDAPYASEITIQHLLSHSAGIPNPIPLNWIHLVSEHPSFKKDEFFNAIFRKHTKTIFKPNEKFAYSNLGYVLLGRIIEKASGISYEKFIEENIINKLNIAPSDLGFKIYQAARHAKGYHKYFDFFNLVLGFFIDKTKFMGNPEKKWQPFNAFYVNGNSYGGLIGTPEAFVSYIQALLTPDSPLISDDFKRKLFTENYTGKNRSTGMCLSWFRGRLEGIDYFTHAGGGGGYYCEIRIYPSKGIGSVVFFNRTGISDERFLDKPDTIFLRSK